MSSQQLRKIYPACGRGGEGREPGKEARGRGGPRAGLQPEGGAWTRGVAKSQGRGRRREAGLGNPAPRARVWIWGGAEGRDRK